MNNSYNGSLLPQNLRVINSVDLIPGGRWRDAYIDFRVDGPYEAEHDIYANGDFMSDPRDPSRLYYVRDEDVGGGVWVYEPGSGWETVEDLE